MAKSAKAAETGTQVIGKAFIVYGTVKAIAPDGTVRVLGPNSVIYADERIVTESEGSISIMLDGPPPSQIDIGRMSDVLLNEDVYAGVTPAATTDASADAEKIQQALEGQGDIELDATAAGGAEGTGGATLVQFSLDGAEGNVTSGAGTTGFNVAAQSTLDALTADDNPEILATTNVTVDETGGLKTVTGTLAFDFGNDGPGAIVLSADGATWDAKTLTLTADDGTWQAVVNADGTYTFTQLAAMHHPDAGNPDDMIPINITATVTDLDGDTATGTFTIAVYDDGPSIGEITSVTVDESQNDTPPNDYRIEAQITEVIKGEGPLDSETGHIDFSFGEDGPGSIVLSVDQAKWPGAEWNEETNTLSWTADGNEDPSWTIVLNPETGDYTFTLLKALDHLRENNEGESLNIKFTATVTDADDDTTSASFTVTVLDDVPTLTIDAGPTVGALNVIEASGDGGSHMVEITAPDYTVTAVDGYTDSVSYKLALAYGAATELETTEGNYAITLDVVDDNTINGVYMDGEGVEQTAFTISLDGTEITLTSFEALEHSNAQQSETVTEVNTLYLSEMINVVATVTVTDGDVDVVQASATAALSLEFEDTDPTLAITADPTVGALNVIEASLALGAVTAGITGLVYTVNAADGYTDAVSYKLALAGGTTATGLHTTDGNYDITLKFVSATQIDGVYTVPQGGGGECHGPQSQGQGPGVEQIAFTISLSGDQVTLTSLVALEHSNAQQSETVTEVNTLYLNNLINVVATVTVTDGDMDVVQASATAALSLQFEDTDPEITFDTNHPTTVGALDVVEASGHDHSDTEDITAPKYTVTAADGYHTDVSYKLALASTTTGLMTTDGHAITLVLDGDGDTIEGVYDGNHTAFTISLTGEHDNHVTLTSLVALEHSNAQQSETVTEDNTLDLNSLINVVATVTVTDGDGDVVTQNSTSSALSLEFLDTNPTAHDTNNETGYDIHKVEGDTTHTHLAFESGDEIKVLNHVEHADGDEWGINKSSRVDFKDDGKIEMENKGSSDSEATELSTPVFNVAAHNQATISFDVDVKESHGEDTFTWSLYKLHGSDWDKVTSGDTHADQDVTYSWTQGDDSGTYRLVFEADDKSSGGDKFKVEIDDIKVTTTTPDTYDIHGIQVDGNLLTDSHPDGSFGADGGYVKSIAANDTNNSDTAADASDDLTVTGEFGGTLKVDSSDGDYIYTPPTNPPANNATEIFTFTLIDGDGDMASAELSILIDAPDNDPGHGGC
jgi:hypothetical protein